MADTNHLLNELQSIHKRLDVMATKSDLEAVKKDLQDVKQSEVQTNTSLGQITTAVEALAAGQKEQATKADIYRLEQKIDKVDKHVKRMPSRLLWCAVSAHVRLPQRGRRLRAQAPPRTTGHPGRETGRGKEHVGKAAKREGM